MFRGKIGRGLVVMFASALLIPAAASAQNTGIAGVVRDGSGAVMPGVTVAASSPALIEKVRSVVTDNQGLYSIVDLRPGTYSVTFTLPGFTSVKREGIELTTSFTATVNAELKVGNIEETITVSGQASVVDTRNVVQSIVLVDAVRESLPTTRSALGMSELIPGISVSSVLRPTGHDVNGVADNRGASTMHGSRSADYQLQLDGAHMTQGGGSTGQAWQANPAEVQEYVYETAALSAETPGGGVRANVIPKEGGNRYTAYSFFSYTNDNLQSDNLSRKLKDLGATVTPVLKHFDINLAAGGPIKRDRLWFFASSRNWGGQDQISGMFEAIDPRSFVFDPTKGVAGNVDVNRPAITEQNNASYSGRVTWQASPRNKFAIYYANQPRRTNGTFTSGTQAFEAARNEDIPIWAIQPTWKSPISEKLLFEASWTDNEARGNRRQSHAINGRTAAPGLGDLNLVGVTDTGTGYSYRLYSGGFSYPGWARHNTAKTALSYVTGGHASKFGFAYEYGYNGASNTVHNNQHINFTFRNGVPIQVTEFNEPYNTFVTFRKLSFFAQDQWTVKRMTVNAGLRFDAQHGSVSEKQQSGPNQFVAFQQWPQIDNVPNWKDVSPRFGVAYDLFGNGKTALKYTLSRYVILDGTAFQNSMNPLQFNLSTTRSWTDSSGNFAVDCDLANPAAQDLRSVGGDICGSIANPAFATGATTTHIDDALREGWGVRQYDWETSASIQQQLFNGLSVNFGYTRRSFANFTVTDNLAVSPSDYDEFCIIAPIDDRLGSTSGSRICGLYDISPAARARTPDNFVTNARKYGTQKEQWQGIDVNVTARLPHHVTLSGGVDSGTQGNRMSSCFVVDSPGSMRFCDVNPPWQTFGKFLGSVDLLWGVNAGVTYQHIPGPQITAAYTVISAQIGSVVQFIKPARTTFSGGSAVVALVSPGTMYSDALNQVDLRLAKRFKYRSLRARLTVDIGNLLNASAVQAQNNTYGGSWQKPTYLLVGRVISPGLLIEF